jgi:hypothetical protein
MDPFDARPELVEGRAQGRLPVVCTLTPDTLATRKAGLLAGLLRRVEASEETENGWRLRFAADAWPAVAETVGAERTCCRFLRFHVVVEPDEGPIWLTLSGPPGTREFLESLISQG